MTAQTVRHGSALAGNATGPLAWIDDIRQAFALHRQYLATLAELSRMTDRELADLGISRLNIAEIASDAAYRRR